MWKGLGLALAGWLVASVPASASVMISIDKSTQRMTVKVDGDQRYVWQVSTGLAGGPPSGTYRPERLERSWFSRKYGHSPMPFAIFFHKGYAIHGTFSIARLGTRASHGCVRLHPANASTLFSIVRQHGADGTTIMIGNGGGGGNEFIARKGGKRIKLAKATSRSAN